MTKDEIVKEKYSAVFNSAVADKNRRIADEEPEYNFKSIGPGVGTGRGPKVLLCFIIGKILYGMRRDKNFT